MRPVRRIFLAGLGMSLIGAAAAEHVYRRAIERRFHQEVMSRQQLERRFNDILTTHEQLMSDLSKERRRTQELSTVVKEKSDALERAFGRLGEEAKTIRELQLRLTAMERQMHQLQGELASALQGQAAGGEESASGAVELERIVVSKADAAAFQGRVVSVHSEWDFIIVDLGWDEVEIGDLVSIYRNEQLMARARIERVQESISAATLLPEWRTTKVQVNDRVQLL